MGHFTISLSNNRLGDVKSGTVRKVERKLKDLFQIKKSQSIENNGYIVKVEPAVGDMIEYHLLKSKEGRWLQKGEHPWIREGDAETTTAIQKAIDEHDNHQRMQ